MHFFVIFAIMKSKIFYTNVSRFLRFKGDEKMLLKNATALLGNFQFTSCDILIQNGIIKRIAPCGFLTGSKVIDCRGQLVCPGLIDIHTHGAMGADTMDASLKSLAVIRRFMAQNGVTSFLPTSMTMKLSAIQKAFTAIKQSYDSDKNGANIVGINMEGPYIHPDRAGAQDPNCIKRADLDEFHALNNLAGGLVKLVTIAPEFPENLACIKSLTAEGVHASCGHSIANYDEVAAAYQTGCDHMTHLYNAMTPLSHRAPGAVGAAFTHDSVYCEIICDGVHVHKAAFLTAYRTKGADHLVLISDSMMAAGLDDGAYELGGLPVNVSGGVARTKDGNLAGSCAKLISCVKKAISFGISREDAFKMASLTPAKSIGIDHQKGSIEEGKDADIILLSEDLSVKTTIIGGEVYSA